MTAAACATQGLLAIFPFIVNGMLSMAVMREMRKRGLDVVLGRYNAAAGVLTVDPCTDFEAENRLISLTRHRNKVVEELDQIAHERSIGLVVNFGAPSVNVELSQLYAELSQLKERAPHLRMLDTLYNSGPHLHAYAAYHTCFDGVLVESDDMVRRLSLPGWPTAHKVESGIDLARFVPADRTLRPVERELCVGYVGRMSIEKNPLGFIELAERLNAALPATRFAMYGEGPMAEQVQARIAGSQLAGIITFCGYADHPTTALAAIDVLVVPSTLDGRPAVVMEANACGVPVIANPIGGISEMIEEGRNGFLVPPRDHTRMAALLASWLADPLRFTALRESARRIAEAQFDRTRMMNAYETVFRSVLARPARPRALAT